MIYSSSIDQTGTLDFKEHDESLLALEGFGFRIIPYLKVVKTADEVISQIEEIGKMRGTLPFDIDGVVIKVNDLALRRTIGENSATPKWAVAYKFPPEEKETKLTDIVIQGGTDGNPDAERCA